jgi:hypothetical protein
MRPCLPPKKTNAHTRTHLHQACVGLHTKKPTCTVVHAYNPDTWKAGVGVSRVQDQPKLQSEFQASLGYIVRPCLQKKKKKERRNPTCMKPKCCT